MSAAICPCCGYDLANDEVIERDGLRFDPRGDIVWHGVAVRCTPTQRILIGSLLKANGRTLSEATLKERIGSDADTNIVRVMISQARRQFRALGHELPIRTDWGRGYRWAAA